MGKRRAFYLPKGEINRRLLLLCNASAQGCRRSGKEKQKSML